MLNLERQDPHLGMALSNRNNVEERLLAYSTSVHIFSSEDSRHHLKWIQSVDHIIIIGRLKKKMPIDSARAGLERLWI